MADIKCFCFLLWISVCSAVEPIYPYSANTKETREYWMTMGSDSIESARKLQPNIAVAKNVIIFLGDGMGVSTVTAARIMKGQLSGHTGEEEQLSFEKFPHIGLSKTYNQDSQTPDSAGTATAFLCGIKTNRGVLGLDARSRRGDCASTNGTAVDSTLRLSLNAEKSAGIVTTTRLTHATPAASYAHVPERDWESDTEVEHCDYVKDIARQLIEDNSDIQVIFGGGRRKFLLNTTEDPENSNDTNEREDKDLVKLWEEMQGKMSRKYQYMWNKTDFDNIDVSKIDSVLGLFNRDHMEYEADRDPSNEPSIAEMTAKAIQILRKNEKGFFLLVEGGRIDHAHHATNAYRSLADTIAFADAVQAAVDLTSETDTLIVTTADHSHVFTIGGYPDRGTPILGLMNDGNRDNVVNAQDDLPYTILMYANGPNAVNGTRANLTEVNTTAKGFLQESAVPLSSETHAGEDVAIYARGPMSHLFHGVHEQNYIAHVMQYASCVGTYSENCAKIDVNENNNTSAAGSLTFSLINALFLVFCLLTRFKVY